MSTLFSLFKRYRAQLGDSVYSTLGLLLMHLSAQLLLFPLFARVLGEAGYGELQYLLAYINVVTVSVGTAANLARITAPDPARREENGNYHLFLLVACLLGIPFCLLIRTVGGTKMDLPFTLTYYLLYVAMIFRYYTDVVYKLNLNYKRYFLYYALIGAGYALGALLFLKTGLWPLAILTGEAAGVLFAYFTEKKLRQRALVPSAALLQTTKIILILTASEGLANLIFNADRLLLKLLIGPTAVTVYYLATLVGKTVSLLSAPLNGVLLGYLSRYKGGLTRRMMHGLLLGSLALILLFTAVCTVGGFLMLVLLYPAELEAVCPFLLVGSLGQVLFFTASVLTVILVRFAKKSYQIYINGIFGLCFFGLGIPATMLFEVWGFAISMVISSTVRWLIAILLGYRLVLKTERKTR